MQNIGELILSRKNGNKKFHKIAKKWVSFGNYVSNQFFGAVGSGNGPEGSEMISLGGGLWIVTPKIKILISKKIKTYQDII